jgi:hypothetical protein
VELVGCLRQQHEWHSLRERGEDRAVASVADHCRDSCQEAIERDESLDAHPLGVDLERRRIAMRADGHDHVRPRAAGFQRPAVALLFGCSAPFTLHDGTGWSYERAEQWLAAQACRALFSSGT